MQVQNLLDNMIHEMLESGGEDEPSPSNDVNLF